MKNIIQKTKISALKFPSLEHGQIRAWLRKITVAMSVITIAFIAWAFWWEPSRFSVEETSLTVPNWPAPCGGLRIAVLANLHVGSPFNQLDKLEKIITSTNAAKPDIILLAGDYVIQGVVGGTITTPEDIAQRLTFLSAPMGVYAVLGNHDWWLNAGQVYRALENVGIKVLEDASTFIQSGDCSFWLTGIGDFWEGKHDAALAVRDIPLGAAILALTHNPDMFPELPARIALTIAGHTHGGQVNIPFIGRPVTASKYGERYASGHIIEDGRHLFVSPGLGTSILPVRFRVPPEISVLIVDTLSQH